MDYSIIIPVYNEEGRIPKTIGQIFSFFSGFGNLKIEIIFVNDGSTDRTEEILQEQKAKNQFKLVSYKENRGKGFAVRQGVKAATGARIIFFDIDLATPLEEFNHLTEFIKAEDQIVIGSRRLAGSAIKKSESRIRTFLGQGFTRISNLLVPGITDFTCGFKCFSSEAAKIIFDRARIDRWGFDTELLYIAKLHHLAVAQMPVEWKHDDDSRVRVLKAVVDSARELAVMKLNQVRGLYK